LFEAEIVPAGIAEGDKPEEQSKSLALPDIFSFPADAKDDRVSNPNHPRQNCIFGIDISHYSSSDIRYDVLRLQRVGFVYVKATQGVGYKDAKFSLFWKKLGELMPPNQVVRGAYHFLSSSDPGRDQADAFIDYLSLPANGGLKAGDLPLVLDLEWDRTSANPDRWVGKGKTYIIDNALACLNRIKERTGRTPVLYTAKSWFSGQTVPLADYDKFKDFPLWVADYNPRRKLEESPVFPGSAKPLLWQFTDRALMTTGYNGGLDASIFYGTDDEFKSKFGLA
jgi:lysozyme